MNAGAVLEIGRYSPADEAELLELERLCPQGTRFRLGFRRPAFRRRAESFDDWAIFTGRVNGRLIAVSAVATKPARLFGAPATVAFGFDLRVHPAFRGHGIGERMTRAGAEWGARRADLVYSWIATGNGASRTVLERVRGRPGARYRYLVCPTYRGRAPELPVRPADPGEVHETHVRRAGPFDVYTDPGVGRGTEGHVGAWIAHRGRVAAGCSAWDNSHILAEVVERLPRPLRIAGAALRSWPLDRPRLPCIPEPGEPLRSWYLHDFFARDPRAARSLIRHVALEARTAGIDFLHLVHLPDQAPAVRAVRAEYPRFLAPVLHYQMLTARDTRRGGIGPSVRTAYVDIRDL
ncbi:MAG: GNAT family N-acetyltransferase [Candidatus Longimicrobiales bacterium M2_2A_002]